MANYHHPPAQTLELHQVLSALGDATRIKIFTILLDRQERTCTPLAALLGISESTLTYHLRILREAGLTLTRPDGVARWVSLRTEDLDERFPGLIKVLDTLLRG